MEPSVETIEALAAHLSAKSPFRVVGAVVASEGSGVESVITVMHERGQRWEFTPSGEPVAGNARQGVVSAVATALAAGLVLPVVESKTAASTKTRPTLQEITDQRHALDVAQTAAEIRRTVHSRGEVIVRRGGGGAFGSSTLNWSDVNGRVTWQAWLAPTVPASGRTITASQWERATAQPAVTWPSFGRKLVLDVWCRALEMAAAWQLEFPSVLDLRGLPCPHGMLAEDFVTPLAAALKKIAVRGIVLLVDDNSWALERCLP